MALTFGSNQFFVAERREPPGEYPSDLPTVTGQLVLFRYKVSAFWLAPCRYHLLAERHELSGESIKINS